MKTVSPFNQYTEPAAIVGFNFLKTSGWFKKLQRGKIERTRREERKLAKNCTKEIFDFIFLHASAGYLIEQGTVGLLFRVLLWAFEACYHLSLPWCFISNNFFSLSYYSLGCHFQVGSFVAYPRLIGFWAQLAMLLQKRTNSKPCFVFILRRLGL